MNKKYNIIEFDEDNETMLKLPRFYKSYVDSFVYYQVIKSKNNNPLEIPEYEFRFHIYKDKAN